MNLDELILGLSLVPMIIALISWLIFSRISMRRIERKLPASSLLRCQWDGFGFRAILYANSLFLPICRANPANNPLIDVVEIRRHATAFDRKLAVVVTLSGWLWVGMVLLSIFFEPK